ncbi:MULTISPECIES: MarR family winged helix-turn-helix transcriptional regulator [unclassified Fusibacter]|uniref:MarR family winged helix-turn-helix transcriptional regulator n=1 Tax=unclassified Fusibacter TaxID=2624464 RepID=UPI0010117078|nr:MULTISPECIES: MarR family transcriptional regulator [unclassified Fusibacter]MCK8059673.1 MarR family transcriptional regulator [Fusibacter sp. A2]NPE21474.1 MarR family transcriptional regulator [Fusibacter sp. A1]RXV61885.1 MarR family transcriptional regulator [Fusibacter sp. A1]
MMNSDEILKLDNQLCFALYAANRAMTKMYKPLLDPFSLTYPQYLVLLVLYERDKLTVNELGDRLYLDSGTLTPLLKRMEQAKLVSRQRSSKDERKVLISLTAKAVKLKESLADVPMTLFREYGCEPTQIVELRETLRSLVDRLQKNT